MGEGWDVDAPGKYTVHYSAEPIEGGALTCGPVEFTRTR
jgi:hypothetical protein